MFNKLPSDPFFEEMDPMEKLWLFHSWAHDNNLELASLKDQAIFIGAFSNLEMAKQMLKGPTFESSDEDFEASFNYVRSQPLPASNDIKEGSQRRRRILNG